MAIRPPHRLSEIGLGPLEALGQLTTLRVVQGGLALVVAIDGLPREKVTGGIDTPHFPNRARKDKPALERPAALPASRTMLSIRRRP